MKINATIDWMIDDKNLGIKSTDFSKISIDTDYVEANEESVNQWVENELAERYGVSFVANEDFTIVNLEDILEDISYSEVEHYKI